MLECLLTLLLVWLSMHESVVCKFRLSDVTYLFILNSAVSISYLSHLLLRQTHIHIHFQNQNWARTTKCHCFLYHDSLCSVYAKCYILQDVEKWIDWPHSDLIEEHNFHVLKAQVTKAGQGWIPETPSQRFQYICWELS